MYHEVTSEMRLQRRLRVLFYGLLILALAFIVLFFWDSARASMEEQAAASIRSSILDTAMQCCAVEGSYPMTLGYMEENYGLRVNSRDFLITYEAFASNVLPTVTVVPR